MKIKQRLFENAHITTYKERQKYIQTVRGIPSFIEHAMRVKNPIIYVHLSQLILHMRFILLV